MQCPICATDNLEDAVECIGCGSAIAPESAAAEHAGPVEGLETTQLASRDLLVDVEALPGVERTELDADPGAAPEWTAGELTLERTEHEAAGVTAASNADVEIDLGREPESGERTPVPPETATCPWCGAVALGAMCDACGRRKSRYTAASARREATLPGETVTCPACFARVVREVRCGQCGMPFPLQEL
jgi:hypothetical protein